MQVSAKKKKGTIVVTLSEKPLFSFLEYEIVSYPHSMVVYGLFDVRQAVAPMPRTSLPKRRWMVW